MSSFGKESYDMAPARKRKRTNNVLDNCKPVMSFMTTSLQQAVYDGNSQLVKLLIQAGCYVNIQNFDYETPIFEAVRNKRREIVEYLCEGRAKLNIRNREGLLPMFYAVKSHDIEITKILLDHGADVNCISKSHDSALHLALREKCLGIIELLVRNGADVNRVYEGHYPIHRAVESQDPDILKCLIEAGAKVNIKLGSGETALFKAIKMQAVDAVNVLISAGADMNAVVDKSPLFYWAIRYHCFDILNLFVKFGADINAVEKGRTPLIFAIRGKFSEDENFSVFDTVQSLLKLGSNANLPNLEGEYPLHAAAELGLFDVVDALIKSGARVNCCDDSNASPLHKAAKKGSIKVTKLLVKSGAEVDYQDSIGNTALHISAKECYLSIIKFLLRWNSDPLIKNKRGQTAFCRIPRSYVSVMVKNALIHRPNLDLPDSVPIDSDFKIFRQEIHRLKNQSISDDSNISYLRFLAENNEDELVSFLSVINLGSFADIVKYFNMHYPRYGDLMIKKFKEAKARQFRLNKSSIIMDHSSLVNLPWLVRHDLFSYLSNEDLDNFATSVLEIMQT